MAFQGWSKLINNFLEKTLWVWLPFVAFYLLIKEILENKKADK